MSHAHHHHHEEDDNEGGLLAGDCISKLGLVAEIAISGGKGLLFLYGKVCFHAWFWLF